MFGIQKGSFIRMIGILIVLLSFGLLLYVSLIVPVDSEENRTIWMGMIMLFCSHMLIVRTYFYLGLLDYDIRRWSEITIELGMLIMPYCVKITFEIDKEEN